uniref:Uncharacterized protein n=1 Tax=Arundo donax TaxID=35708 RepID=A0A0A9HET3_ARUDO
MSNSKMCPLGTLQGLSS